VSKSILSEIYEASAPKIGLDLKAVLNKFKFKKKSSTEYVKDFKGDNETTISLSLDKDIVTITLDDEEGTAWGDSIKSREFSIASSGEIGDYIEGLIKEYKLK